MRYGTRSASKTAMGLLNIFKRSKPRTAWDALQVNPLFQQQKALFDAMSMMCESGCDADELPNARGEFGYSAHNPIPTKTVFGSTAYLARLRAPDGAKVLHDRRGSSSSDVVDTPIDVYDIKHPNGTHLAKLYFSPYQKRNSTKPPRGLSLIEPPPNEPTAAHKTEGQLTPVCRKNKRSVPDIAGDLIEWIAAWPFRQGQGRLIKRDFSDIVKRPFGDVNFEMIYFLAFSIDVGLHCMLKDKPQLRNELRDGFNEEVRKFVRHRGCKPLPIGEWLDDKSRLWLSTGELPAEPGTPLANLNDRFQLYAEALKRGKGQSVGQSLGYIFCGLCGTTDIELTYAAMEMFNHAQETLRNVLDSSDISV